MVVTSEPSTDAIEVDIAEVGVSQDDRVGLIDRDIVPGGDAKGSGIERGQEGDAV